MQHIQLDRPIFMIGMPRSGTTMISEIISVHEDLGWISNFMAHFPSFYWISFLNRITDIPVIGRHLRAEKPQAKSSKSKFRYFLPYCAEAYSVWEHCCGKKFRSDYLINQTASDDERAKITAFFRKVLRFQGKKRFFTKITGPPRIHYLNSIFPDAYFIHIVRDPRAVISSLMKVDFWKKYGLDRPWWENGLPDDYIREWIDSNKSPVGLAAIQWKWVVELMWSEKKNIEKERFLEIHYEDFIINPHKELMNIFKKLDLRDSLLAQRYLNKIQKTQDHNKKYRDILKESEIEMIEKLTSSTAEKAGYYFEVSN